MKALEKDREARFANADEMRQALLSVAPGLPPSAVVVAGNAGAPLADTPVPTRRMLPGATAASTPAQDGAPRSRPWLYAGLVVTVAALWVGISRSGQRPPPPSPAASAQDLGASAERPPTVAPATGERTGDDAVLADVQRLIAGSSALREARIEIAVANGIVTLSGEAPTSTARDLAVTLAATARGVKRVFNMVEVTPAGAATDSPAPPPASEPPPPHP
jgi:hypothetical protein